MRVLKDSSASWPLSTFNLVATITDEEETFFGWGKELTWFFICCSTHLILCGWWVKVGNNMCLVRKLVLRNQRLSLRGFGEYKNKTCVALWDR